MQLLVQVVVHEAKCNRMMLAECYLARLRYEKVIIFSARRVPDPRGSKKPQKEARKIDRSEHTVATFWDSKQPNSAIEVAESSCFEFIISRTSDWSSTGGFLCYSPCRLAGRLGEGSYRFSLVVRSTTEIWCTIMTLT